MMTFDDASNELISMVIRGHNNHQCELLSTILRCVSSEKEELRDVLFTKLIEDKIKTIYHLVETSAQIFTAISLSDDVSFLRKFLT